MEILQSKGKQVMEILENLQQHVYTILHILVIDAERHHVRAFL